MGNNPKKSTVRKSNSSKLDEVFHAASHLFVEKGYDQTSVQDIAEAVGILKGSLYHYIDSKEDILYWLILNNHEALYETMIRAQDEQGLSAMERVERFVHNHTNFVLENVEQSVAFQLEFKTLSLERQEEILMLRRRYESYLIQLLEQVQKDKVMCAHLNLELVVRAILSMINSIQRWYHPESRFDASEVAWHYAELSMRAIAFSGSTALLPDHSWSQDSLSSGSPNIDGAQS